MRWHALSAETVLTEVDSCEEGLSSREATRRLHKYGYNQLEQEEATPIWKIFVRQFTDFLVIILIIAAAVSFLSSFWGEGGGQVEAILILLILIANGIFGFLQEYKAEKSIAQLREMASPQAIVRRNGHKETVPAEEIVPGDILLLREGDIVPADARLLSAEALAVDESSLTGESEPVHTNTVAVAEDTALADRANMVYMTTSVVRGNAVAIVVETGMSTQVGAIAHRIQQTEERQTPFQRELAQLGKTIGTGVLLIAAFVVIVLLFSEPINLSQTTAALNEIVELFIIGVSLAVAAVPEGLPIVVTLALALGSRRMVRQRSLVRHLAVVEGLGSVDTICSDKTGTLTEGRMTVRRLWCDNAVYTVTGRGHTLEGEFMRENETVSPSQFALLLRIGFLCNNAEMRSANEFSGDPTEIALLVSGLKAGMTPDTVAEYERVDSFPFSSARKMMSTVYRQGETEWIFSKGAPEVILDACRYVYENGDVVELNKEKRQAILEQNERFARDALRVLGFAYKQDGERTEDDLVFVGLQGMIDPPRQEVLHAIEECRDAGIRVIMVTGDHAITAQAIAENLRFSESEVITGPEIEHLSDEELQETVTKVSVFARVSPEHKVQILEALQKSHFVAMTGDGVNDAPALKQADVGVSMGERGTDVAKQSSDMVLLDDNFATIRNAVKEGRGIFDNIRKFVNYLLSANMGEVLLVFLATMGGVLLASGHEAGAWVPLFATQLLWINVLTDGLPALALGADPVSQNVMRRPPRKKAEGVITSRMLYSIFAIGAAISLVTLGLFIFLHDNVTQARTVVFTSLVVFEFVRIYHIRSRYQLGILSNKWLVAAVLGSFALHIALIYSPFAQFFHVTAMTFVDWLYVAIAFSVFSFLSAGIQWVEQRWFGEAT